MIVFMRCVLLGALASAGTALASDTSGIYFVRNVITTERVPGALTQTAFNRVTRTRHRDGSTTMNMRALWSSENGFGQSGGTLALDPDDTQEGNLLALMAGGFDMRVERDGTVRDVRAVDQKAVAEIVAKMPEAERMLAMKDADFGMRPFPLPTRLQIGQQLVRRERSTQHGEVTTRMRVRALTDDVALMDVELEGEGITGTGRHALLRSDGTPIELRAQLRWGHTEDGTEMTHDIRLFRLSDEPDLDMTLDDDAHRDYLASVATMLTSPPFSAVAQAAGGLQPEAHQFHPLKHGELERWMLPESAIAAVEDSLLFGVTREGSAARPIITLGGQVGDVRPEDAPDHWMPQMMMARLESVALLDAAGRPLPGLEATPVLPRLLLYDRYRVRETSRDFPFRLPLQTRGSQLEALESIRFEVGVETYAWEGVEAVHRGAQSTRNPDVRVVWSSPSRVTVEQRRGRPDDREGLWTVAVPLDADGTEMPAASLNVSHAPVDAGVEAKEGSAGLPLDWEHRQAGLRQEIATPQPIAALELRHYRYAMVPRTWTFRNARSVVDVEGAEAE